jgi:hypothetical protein
MFRTYVSLGHARRWLLPLLLISCAAACTTGVSDSADAEETAGRPGASASGSGSGSGSAAAVAGGSGSIAGSSGSAGTAEDTPATRGLWRQPPTTTLDSGRAVLASLNNSQYDNTVRDLLGTMSPPSKTYTIPADEENELFKTNGQTLTFSNFKFEQLQEAAEGLVTELLARPAADPVRARVLSCTPTLATLGTCLTSILTPFLAKAYRRPVTADEVAPFVTLGTTIATAHKDPTPGLAGALQAVLLSPNFLFRVETSAVVGSATPVPVNDYELATRLSFFIGSTMPDTQLTAAAAAGQLTSGAGYDAQIDRLVADADRLGTFVRDFGARWLSLVDTAGVAPDETMFAGQYNDALRLSTPQETSRFFADLITTQAPLSTLLTANYSFVNDSLAKHYGIPSPGGAEFKKVTFPPDSHRQGILTQETFLTTTSLAARTSPVKRGVWVLENLLCDGTPAPPNNIADLVEEGPGTVRQKLEHHRELKFCATCHNLIDPLGLALENYDAIGKYRTIDNGSPIDANTTTLEGAQLDGGIALANHVAKDPRLAWCLTKQVMTFAVGRSFEPPDARAYVRGIAEQMGATPTWAGLIKAVAKSQAFLTARGE